MNWQPGNSRRGLTIVRGDLRGFPGRVDLCGVVTNQCFSIKIEAGAVDLPAGAKRKFYDWDDIEKQVIASIESGEAKPPHTMAPGDGFM